MPITDYTFEDGILYAREYDRITKEDALEWVKYVRHYARESDTPLITVIDATAVIGIDLGARRVFANATTINNYEMSMVATNSVLSDISSRVVSTTAIDPHTQFFKNIQLAWHVARQAVAKFREDASDDAD